MLSLQVCPCCYTMTTGKYRAMYNVDDEDTGTGVQFEKKTAPSNGVGHGGTTV